MSDVPDCQKIQPLRERRNISLRVETSRSAPTSPTLEQGATPHKPPPAPKHEKRKHFLNGGMCDPLAGDRSIALHDLPLAKNTIGEEEESPLPSFQRLTRGLYIAVMDQVPTDMKMTFAAGLEIKFTHAVVVSPEETGETAEDSTGRVPGVIQSIDDYGVNRLDVYAPKEGTDPAVRTRLSVSQLVTARDFLTLALPYATIGAAGTQPRGTDVCVLITSTPDCPADVMVIAVSYLAFITKEPASKVWGLLDGDKGVLDMWKRDVPCKEVMEIVKTVAGAE
jgi:hypothetical protein